MVTSRMIQPLVSIITPCFNNHDTIIETIECVQKQSYPKIEHIIVDDGSNTPIAKTIQQFIDAQQVKYFRQSNQGVAAARNHAVKQATGEILVFLDADDLLAPNYIEKVVQAFQQHPQSSMVACYVTEFGRSTSKTKIKPFHLEDFYFYNSLFPSIISIKKQYFDQINGYNPTLKVCEDWDLYLRIAKINANVHIIPEYLFFYRKHDNSSSLTDLMSKDKLTVHKAYFNLYQAHKEYYDKQLLSPLNVAYLNIKSQKRINKVLKTTKTLSIVGSFLSLGLFFMNDGSLLINLISILLLVLCLVLFVIAKNTLKKMKSFQLNQLPSLNSPSDILNKCEK